MSIKYICDICGKELKKSIDLQKLSIVTYEKKGYPSVGEWSCYACRDCRKKVAYEMSAAARREIACIKMENRARNGECKNVSKNPMRFECSKCGGVSLEMAPRHCPCCGTKVMTDDQD